MIRRVHVVTYVIPVKMRNTLYCGVRIIQIPRLILLRSVTWYHTVTQIKILLFLSVQKYIVATKPNDWRESSDPFLHTFKEFPSPTPLIFFN